jgi:protease-4
MMNDSPPSTTSSQSREADSHERRLIERVLLATVEEQRRSRRWKIFFRFAWLGAFILFLFQFQSNLGSSNLGGASRHTALIEVKGLIDAEGESSADHIVEALQQAFGDPRTAGVVLRVNSPGGSPVQAGIIFDEIRRLRAKHSETPVFAVVEEICTSGGYYVAAAADQIYVDRASLVGSIGVLMDGFGFVETMKKLGVERRLLTAGENKAFLDSFSPASDRHVTHAQAMLNDIHQQFIAAVRAGRGERLKDDPQLFSGLVWSGARSVELGLADGLGSLSYVARELIKAEEIVDFSRHENLADRLARRLGAQASQAVASGLRSVLEGVRLR